MQKKVISDAKNKVNVVILRNDALDIYVKGISKCHEGDTYNEEFGINLANTRAWLKYYQVLDKKSTEDISWLNEMLEWYESRLLKATEGKKVAESKYAEIKKEYEELLKTV